jgi:gliding motility-associated-like protein
LGSCTQQEIIIDVGGDLNIYSGISPNSDLFNEKWIIQNIESLPETKSNHVSIFNRWGDVVFEVDNYDNNQNVFIGLNKSGDKLSSGIYFYKIEFSSGLKTQTGYLTLKH